MPIGLHSASKDEWRGRVNKSQTTGHALPKRLLDLEAFLGLEKHLQMMSGYSSLKNHLVWIPGLARILVQPTAFLILLQNARRSSPKWLAEDSL